ncbi:hypothetical protein NGB36_29470 [Streptomyces sp. RB6PN25]|uniref:Uncharacterized protein n=1 Tax=Streptomyces humicola TaxID=2953240 RepID=A0ABT1Q5J6_9ACTN|nr:hypothetical protein [Streptomyces humicola]MCQ4084595.1 hypothetical protein [Streptomyces humicola]
MIVRKIARFVPATDRRVVSRQGEGFGRGEGRGRRVIIRRHRRHHG